MLTKTSSPKGLQATWHLPHRSFLPSQIPQGGLAPRIYKITTARD